MCILYTIFFREEELFVPAEVVPLWVLRAPPWGLLDSLGSLAPPRCWETEPVATFWFGRLESPPDPLLSDVFFGCFVAVRGTVFLFMLLASWKTGDQFTEGPSRLSLVLSKGRRGLRISDEFWLFRPFGMGSSFCVGRLLPAAAFYKTARWWWWWWWWWCWWW